MAGTKRTRDGGQNVTFAQTSPVTLAAVTMTGIHGTDVDLGLSFKQESADGDAFMTAMFMDMQNPTVTFDTIYPQVAAGIIPGNRGTLTFSIRDAANLLTASGGGYTYVITNAYKTADNEKYMYREFGKSTIPFGCISSDGQTNPVTINSL